MVICISNQINLSSASASIKNGSHNSVMIFNNMNVLQKHKHIIYNQVSLVNAQIPRSYYTVNDTNNLLVLSTGSYTLINGNYNATTFNTMVSSLIGASFTMSFSTSTGKYTLSKTGGFSILESTTCYKLLGIAKSTTYTTTSSLTMPYLCNFLGPNRIKIKSSVFKTENLDSSVNGHGELLETIAVNASQYSLITYENIVGFKNTVANTDINFIDITLTDELDNILDFNGVDVGLNLFLISKITSLGTRFVCFPRISSRLSLKWVILLYFILFLSVS